VNKKLKWGTPEYKRIHRELSLYRGPASDHNCIDCKKDASQWSYNHGSDPLILENYFPRCEPCHRKYDFQVNGNHMAKLTDDQVREIRKRYHSGETRKELSKIFGVAPSTIANVALRIKYKNVV